jgi:hypothetical protein
MPSTASKVVAIVFVAMIALAGPVILTIDAVVFVRTSLFVHSAARTEGTVVGLTEFHDRTGRRRNTGRPSYAPVFRFTANDGETYTVVSNTYSSTARFAIGQQVMVLYEKGHPEHAKIDAFLQLWLPEMVLTIVGGAFCVLPALLIFRRIQQARM